MKVIYNTLIPFKGFRAINLFGVLFVRKGCELNSVTLKHEAIPARLLKRLFSIWVSIRVM